MAPQLSLEGEEPVLLFPEGRKLRIDFISDRVRYWRSLRGRQELIAKAVGFSQKKSPTVFDATLGLAEDAWTLARLGAQVIGCEREALLSTLLGKALERARANDKTREIAERLNFRQGEACAILPELAKMQRFDAVFLDPMFPASKKTALPRLEMQLLRDWLSPDERDFAELFELALKASERVVVKRPLHAPLFRENPVHQFKGKSVRYDLYKAKGSL